jgi:hypothetical protein
MNTGALNMAGESSPAAIDRSLAGIVLSCMVGSVWLLHGLCNKLLHGSPRHLLIVQSVPGLSGQVGEIVLNAVGAAEVLLALWIISGIRPWLALIVQTIALLSMNVVELTFAREHLLWPMGLIPLNLAFLTVGAGAAARREPLVALRRHPIPMAAHFQHCLVLTYAFPAEALQKLLPAGLEVDRYGRWGFVAIALVQTDSMRPAGLPRWTGQRFFLSGYRIFVKHHDGKRTRRGLRILRSDTDKRRMVIAGNALTHYNYGPCTAAIRASSDTLAIELTTPNAEADLAVVAELANSDGRLPAGSVFASERDARRFAGPLPWTFDWEPETGSIIAIKGVRTRWHPKLAAVHVAKATWFDNGPLRRERPILCSAFHVSDIDYRWERGVVLPVETEVT